MFAGGGGELTAIVFLQRSNFLRITFAGSEETMETAMPVLGKVLRDFFAA